MQAGIIFSGTGPILVLTTYESLSDPNFIDKLGTKGIKKYIAYGVSEALVKEKYGKHFNMIMQDLHQSDDLRVLDYDGHHIMSNFSLTELGEAFFHE